MSYLDETDLDLKPHKDAIRITEGIVKLRLTPR